MGGTASERVLGTEKGRAFNRRMQSYGTHAGEQTGLVMEGIHHGMRQVADTIDRSDFNLTKYGRDDSGGDGTTSSVGEYSSQKTGAQKASGTKGGDLKDKKKGKKKGLSQLQVRKN